jgi:hypothetical protein
MFTAYDSIHIIIFIRLILLGILESVADKNLVEELLQREIVLPFVAVSIYSDYIFSLVGLQIIM